MKDSAFFLQVCLLNQAQVGLGIIFGYSLLAGHYFASRIVKNAGGEGPFIPK